MKVVLFCGGLGTRIRDFSENIPKPLVPIGSRPILVNLMRYYAHYGHKDFVLCLGYRADAIKQYFLEYNEAMSNDFVLTKGGREVELLQRDIDDWTITFVDTGLHSNIGERLLAVKKHVAGEEVFLANYSDGLTDLPLTGLHRRLPEDRLRRPAALGARPACVPHRRSRFEGLGSQRSCTSASRRCASTAASSSSGARSSTTCGPEKSSSIEPFHRLIEKSKLRAYPYDGFWASMDTFKDKQRFEDLLARGHAPWQVWKT